MAGGRVAVGPSTARAEKNRLAQQLDARSRSKTFGFGLLARAKELSQQIGKPAHPAHMTGILRALGAKPRLKATAGGLTLAQTSALGATTFGGSKS